MFAPIFCWSSCSVDRRRWMPGWSRIVRLWGDMTAAISKPSFYKTAVQRAFPASAPALLRPWIRAIVVNAGMVCSYWLLLRVLLWAVSLTGLKLTALVSALFRAIGEQGRRGENSTLQGNTLFYAVSSAVV